MYASGPYTVAAIAKSLGVSRASIYRHLTGRTSWLSRRSVILLNPDGTT
jgi:transcriptional antiterminator